jgi:hypothetical protein
MFHTCAIITGQNTSKVIAVGIGLLPEDAYARIYRGPVCYRLYLYVQGCLHAYDGLELLLGHFLDHGSLLFPYRP